MSKTITPSAFACGVGLECENKRVRLKGILVEQDSDVHVASVLHELIGDVRNMITGFLWNSRMKLTTSNGDNVGRISARRARIPLKKGKAELMVQEIAVNCVLDCPNLTMRRTNARGLGKGPVPIRGSAPTRLWVPTRAVLAGDCWAWLGKLLAGAPCVVSK